jgi:hypothetical protein
LSSFFFQQFPLKRPAIPAEFPLKRELLPGFDAELQHSCNSAMKGEIAPLFSPFQPPSGEDFLRKLFLC